MNSYIKETTVGNIVWSIYVDFIRSIQDDDEIDLLEEREEEYISSHLFNLEQAESVIDELNKYLEDAVSVGYLLKFLNDEADCIETVAMEPKEKKQRYVIVIVNALASTLWRHTELQKRFIERCRLQLGIDSVTWNTQSSRIRHASPKNKTVSRKTLNLREDLYDLLNIPEEHRL